MLKVLRVRAVRAGMSASVAISTRRVLVEEDMVVVEEVYEMLEVMVVRERGMKLEKMKNRPTSYVIVHCDSFRALVVACIFVE